MTKLLISLSQSGSLPASHASLSGPGLSLSIVLVNTSFILLKIITELVYFVTSYHKPPSTGVAGIFFLTSPRRVATVLKS